MPARLILNADDFGLTRGINRAIAELHDAGALTSATLMANGAAFEDAVSLALVRPTLGVGCHIVLTDGIPVADPSEIPSLLGSDGKSFRASLPEFIFAVLRGHVREPEVEREAVAQVQRLQRAGIQVSHLDTHKHTHILPGVARPLLGAAERTGVGAIRNPFEQRWSLALGRAEPLRRVQVRLMAHLRPAFEALPQIRSGAVLTSDGTLGISATGHLTPETLGLLLAAIPSGVWELVCHPGYHDEALNRIATRLRAHRDVERRALLSAFPFQTGRPNLNQSPPELIHYGQLAALGSFQEGGQLEPTTGREPLV